MTDHMFRGALGAAAFAALCSGASAHVTLERKSAVPDTPYRGVLQINHGCRGAATTAVSVTVPDGVIGVRPVPKPGWSLAIRREAFKKPYRLYGETLSEGAREITWSGGSLPDDQYDEFTFMARITEDYAPGATVYFPVVQTCGDAASRWIEEPGAGQTSAQLKSPAPAVRIVAKPDDAAAGGAIPGNAANTAPPPAGIERYTLGTLTIERPWMRATPNGAKVAGGYLRVTNGGTVSDRLVSASIPAAGHGEVHEMSMEAGVMKMRPVEGGIEIGPGRTVELKPGGFHLMFMDLRSGAKEGETVRGSLTFEKAGTIAVTFGVAGLGAQTPGAQAPAPGHQH